MSRIGDSGERAYIHVYRRGFASRLFNQLASHPGVFDSLQELMGITLELDTRYHERQKEEGSHQGEASNKWIQVLQSSSKFIIKDPLSQEE
ncbi:hypothetical protein O181_063133 [Austropuccinia psidii MF-1]|uniref:Uncharacterized protein n=1 Tax=Austropuccinia psidii MF-1 TaxID=1389203 RepID=A0A9Q3I0A6_9BASI|nr:hypothetical protein [Austropuccinia psidii MF-1]